MLLAYRHERNDDTRLWLRPRAGERVIRTFRRDRLERFFPVARCALLLAQRLDDGPYGVIPLLRELTNLAPLTPVVLVTDGAPANLVWLRLVMIDEVVLVPPSARTLRRAITHATRRNYLDPLARVIRGAPYLPDQLRDALQIACDGGDRTPRTLQGLARRVGCSRSTLWNQWRRLHAGSPPRRLEEVLWSLQLLAVLRLRTRGVAVAEIAESQRLDEKTIGRRMRRLTGATPAELTGEEIALEMRRLAERIVRDLRLLDVRARARS